MISIHRWVDVRAWYIWLYSSNYFKWNMSNMGFLKDKYWHASILKRYRIATCFLFLTAYNDNVGWCQLAWGTMETCLLFDCEVDTALSLLLPAQQWYKSTFKGPDWCHLKKVIFQCVILNNVTIMPSEKLLESPSGEGDFSPVKHELKDTFCLAAILFIGWHRVPG